MPGKIISLSGRPGKMLRNPVQSFCCQANSSKIAGLTVPDMETRQVPAPYGNWNKAAFVYFRSSPW
jgi:hypothetical protein